MILLIWIWIFIVFWMFFNIFLLLLEKKIELLEKRIIDTFKKRSNLIPALFEISKNYIEKENEVFEEVLYLRKLEFYNISSKNINFVNFIENEKKIHYEIEFLFKVFDKKPKILKNEKFLYTKENLLDITNYIWKNIILYKNIVQKYNFLLNFKNITIIWLFFQIEKKEII